MSDWRFIIALVVIVLATIVNSQLVDEFYVFNYHIDVPNQANEFFKSQKGQGQIPIQNRHIGYKLSYYHVLDWIYNPDRPLLINSLNTSLIFHTLTFFLILAAALLFLTSWSSRLFLLGALTLGSPGFISIFGVFSKEATSHGLLMLFFSYATHLYTRGPDTRGIKSHILLGVLLALAILNRSIATVYLTPFLVLFAGALIRREAHQITSLLCFFAFAIGLSLVGFELLQSTLHPSMVLDDNKSPIAIASSFMMSLKTGYSMDYPRFSPLYWRIFSEGLYRFIGGSLWGALGLVSLLPLIFLSFRQLFKMKNWLPTLLLATSISLPILFEPTHSFRWAKTWTVIVIICAMYWDHTPKMVRHLAVCALLVFLFNNTIRFKEFKTLSHADMALITSIRNAQSLTIKRDDIRDLDHIFSINPSLIGNTRLLQESEPGVCQSARLDGGMQPGEWQNTPCLDYDEFVSEIEVRSAAF